MIVDEPLLGRLDRVAAVLGLEMADGYRTVEPGGPSAARSFGPGALVALGPARWVNRAIGVPVSGDRTTFDEMEAFFVAAGVPPAIEIGTWAAPAALATLASRGYAIEWFRDLFVRRPGPTTADDPGDVTVCRVDDGNGTSWTGVFTRAFGGPGESDSANAGLHSRAMLLTPSTTHFVAHVDGEAVGCASLSVVDGVAWLGGAATLPSYRGRGIQAALLRHRLALAADAGCSVAAATATPSGTSARNLRRAGFTLATAQAVLTHPPLDRS